MQPHERLVEACFAASPQVRYVAAYLDGQVGLRSRADVQLLGSNESDQYEELIVNPTLIKLLTQRGNIDCGGFRHAVATVIRPGAVVIVTPESLSSGSTGRQQVVIEEDQTAPR